MSEVPTPSAVPHTSCNATIGQLLQVPGKSVEDFCAGYQDIGVRCRVSAHPTAGKSHLFCLVHDMILHVLHLLYAHHGNFVLPKHRWCALPICQQTQLPVTFHWTTLSPAIRTSLVSTWLNDFTEPSWIPILFTYRLPWAAGKLRW